MNVQQINETGHDISTFIITSVVMVVSVMFVWAASAKFTSSRNKVIDRDWQDYKEMGPRSLKEKLLFVDVSTDRLRYWRGLWLREFQWVWHSLAIQRVKARVKALWQSPSDSTEVRGV